MKNTTCNMKNGWVKNAVLTPPSLADNTADAERLLLSVADSYGQTDITLDRACMRDLPKILRESDSQVRVVAFPNGNSLEILEVSCHSSNEPILGIAVDLGTTRIVVRLLDLLSGETLGETSLDNPQSAIGPDVLTRIHHAGLPEGLEELSGLVADAISRTAKNLARNAGSDGHRILAAAVAGNTAMTHLFLGLDPYNIIREPYIPAVNKPGTLNAQEIGLKLNPRARVFVFPNVGSYFGGDLISGILATGMHRKQNVCMLVDVGTNAEVVVGNQDWLMACAGAAGPALEQGVSKMGMTAGPGAIERVEINPESGVFSFQTVENEKPLGICGSGVIDMAAQLFLSGMIDLRGKFIKEACGDRLIETDGMQALILVPGKESGSGKDLLFTQADLDSLVRSKAAMYSILYTITATVGVDFTDLESFFIAGTFGSYIDPKSAIAIGMIPDLSLETYQAMGNTSLEGAQKVLLSTTKIQEANAIRDQITYMELNVNQEFMNRFSAAKFFPHTNPDRFPSVIKWMKKVKVL